MNSKNSAVYAKHNSQAEAESAALSRSIAARMNVNFLMNQDGGVWMLHDKPLPGVLRWVEYDMETEIVTLITYDGETYELGLDVPLDMGAGLVKATQITVAQVKGKDVIDFAMVPILTRDLGIN